MLCYSLDSYLAAVKHFNIYILIRNVQYSSSHRFHTEGFFFTGLVTEITA